MHWPRAAFADLARHASHPPDMPVLIAILIKAGLYSDRLYTNAFHPAIASVTQFPGPPRFFVRNRDLSDLHSTAIDSAQQTF
ncbi:hypothetical protein [Burkholderia sp. ABCPW 14]|uniref:hypothetical protein n=1 Tax=Burkholderia sp. ABCPW 14 TaxID=1637860 RepID=UPI0012E3ADB0|nr:hypothetical protein [Burkholderia sp. ABCPW 14]